jgi:hypothetical protein
MDLGSRTSVQQQVRASRWETVVEAIYVVDLQSPFAESAMWVVVQAASDPARLEPDIRRAIQAIGIYGVLAGDVADRAREIALRSAIGASRGRIMALVLRQAAGVGIAGVLVGAAVASLASRGLTALLFEVSPLDVLTYVALAGVLLVATGTGALLPAWRAARIAPSTALQA